jgi:hypothetical protein
MKVSMVISGLSFWIAIHSLLMAEKEELAIHDELG